MPTMRQLKSCFYGLAFGDALGKDTEFIDVESIYAQWPPQGPTDLPRPVALVTDDTQMALAIADALIDTQPHGTITPTIIEPLLRKHFVRWYNDPDNNRAPGNTCLQACEALETGIRWQDACVKNSKGCGANMRVAPVAMIDDRLLSPNPVSTGPSDIRSETYPETHPEGQLKLTHSPQRAALAQFQAALTHGHATALAASDLTTYALVQLFNAIAPQDLVADLMAYATSQRLIYHHEWLGDLWQRPGISTPDAYISRGWDECLTILKRLNAALGSYNPAHDPCRYTGDGWIAEEAMATGLLCFLTHVDAPQKALTRAAASRGDSDSIACLAGAFAGAYGDFSIWPPDWPDRIEYRERMDRVCQGLVQRPNICP